jgi:hypothetical protein
MITKIKDILFFSMFKAVKNELNFGIKLQINLDCQPDY